MDDRQEIGLLREKLAKQEQENMYPRQITDWLEQLLESSGLEAAISKMLNLVKDNFGGENLCVYYFVESEWHYADISGKEQVLAQIGDKRVLKVFKEGSQLEDDPAKEGNPHESQGGNRSGCLLYPLKSGEQTFGVIKVEGIVHPFFISEEYFFRFLNLASEILFTRLSYSLEINKANIRSKELTTQVNLIIDTAQIGTWEWDVQAGETTFNEKWTAALGYTVEELEPLTVDKWKSLFHPVSLKVAREVFQEYISGKNDFLGFEFRLKHKDGQWVWISCQGKAIKWDNNGNPSLMQGTFIDITKRKIAEEKLERVNRLYAVASQINQAIVHQHEQKQLFNEVCRIIIEFGKFRMAWIGMVDKNSKKVIPVAVAGYEDGYLSAIRQITTENKPEGRGPVGTAIREDHYFVCNDIASDPRMSIWKEPALERGYRSAVSVPLRLCNKAIGAFSIYAADPGYFNAEEIKLLEEVAFEISYAIGANQTEKEHQKAVQALAASESKFRSIFNSVSEAILILDPSTGKVLECNQAAVNMYGYTFEEFIEVDPADFSYYDSQYFTRESVAAKFQSAREESEITFEWKGKRKNGEIFWTETSLKRWLIDDKERVIAVVRDISGRKEAEEQIRLMKTVIENSPTIIFRWKAEEGWPVEYVSENIESQLGYTPDELKSGEIKYIDIIYPEDRARVGQEVAGNSGREINTFIQEYRVVTRDGSVRWVVDHSQIGRDKEGKILFYEGVVLDQTDRKQAESALRVSEEKYRLITENTFDVIWIYNTAKQKYTYVSPSVRLSLGYTIDEFKSKTLEELVSPESARMIREIMEKEVPEFLVHRDTNRTHKIFEIEQPRKDGQTIWIEIATQYQFNRDGEVEILGISRDIKERKKMEAELRRSESELKELNATKDKFFSIIAHDLKSPFNSILGFSELLMNQSGDLSHDEITQYASVIYSSSRQTLAYLDNLLEWARIQQGRISFTPKLTVLFELANDAISLVKANASRKNISVVNKIPQYLIATVDENMIRTLFRNLLDNAVKFTRKGGNVAVSAIIADRKIVVSVADNGIGMCRDNLDSLFNVGSGFTTRGTENEKGTGLGLILCHEFIEKHGGKIWAESEEGKGSTFFFSLPFEM